MQRLAVIGAGISGLSTAHFLKTYYDIVVFEKEKQPGGLIRCKTLKEGLFHICGGHVFNTKRKDVNDWFWSKFDQQNEFVKADRNSIIYMDGGGLIPYPIENHMYLLDENVQKSFIKDMVTLGGRLNHEPQNFEEFLRYRFGDTLYNLYFQPYNQKIWRKDLRQVPLSWLEGKLPKPSVEEILFNNINHVEEKEFVHSSFWYSKTNGSQFIADRLAESLPIIYNTSIKRILYNGNKWMIDDDIFDMVVFCGNIKDMIKMIKGIDLNPFITDVESLDYHGTTSVFCEIEKNPYSWIYQPSGVYESHRIICTGNFSDNNNTNNRLTGTIEFTDYISNENIMTNLKKMPFNPQYITHSYNEYTYPIQDKNTRFLISELKRKLEPLGFFFTGRFADWEYYNMDVAIGASNDMCKRILL